MVEGTNASEFIIYAEITRRCICGGIFTGKDEWTCNKCGLRLVNKYGYGGQDKGEYNICTE